MIEAKKLPKLILTDIDGVWTDGGMYYDQLGNEWKKFNTYDSAGVLFAKKLNIRVGIITGEDTEIVRRRSQKLEVDFLLMGINDKYSVIRDLCNRNNIEMSDVAYIGDDLNDLNVFRKVGFSACPSSAPDYVKNCVSWVCQKKGGEGVFREFVELLLDIKNYEDVLNILN